MLSSLKVVELATMVAAPAAAGLLADWGAQVVKIEPHSGDPMRGAPGSPLGSINFDLHNRNKRSIALNTAAPDTRDVIIKLVAQADIFITNVLPGQLEKLRLDWATLHALFPRLVYGAVSSFGPMGPDRDRGATDNLGFWARAGGTALLTVEGQDPLPIRQSVGDRITGALTCAGILAAALEAQRSGRGRFVDTSLLSAGMWTFSTDISNYLNRGRTALSKGRRDAVMPLANYFRTRDGRWLQVHTNVTLMAKALSRPDLADDPRFNGPQRPTRENNAALVDLLDQVVSEFDYEDIKARFEAAGVRCEPVNMPADLKEDPQVRATGRLIEVEGGADAARWQVASPWILMEEDAPLAQRAGVAPGIGRHTSEILEELGYSAEAIARMRANGTIPSAQDG